MRPSRYWLVALAGHPADTTVAPDADTARTGPSPIWSRSAPCWRKQLLAQPVICFVVEDPNAEASALIWEQGRQQLALQSADLDLLRTRAVAMLSVAALVAGLFGIRIPHDHLHGRATACIIAALVLFAASTVLAVLVAAPRRNWQFTFRLDALLQRVDSGDAVPADVTRNFAAWSEAARSEQRPADGAPVRNVQARVSPGRPPGSCLGDRRASAIPLLWIWLVAPFNAVWLIREDHGYAWLRCRLQRLGFLLSLAAAAAAVVVGVVLCHSPHPCT